MTLQTVWHDNGTVKCVDSEDSPAVIHGADKATADTDVVGEITLYHVVTVKDGVVTKAEYVSPPINWLARLTSKRERHLNTSITVTLSDGDHVIPVSDRSAALAPHAEKRARRHNKTVPFPTGEGVVRFNATDLEAIEDAIGAYLEAVWDRIEELETMIEAGTITEADLEQWPSA